MNIVGKIGLTAAAFIACASAASAATVTTTQTKVIGPRGPGMDATQTFAKSPIPLASVSDTITENLTEKIVFSNTGSVTASASGFVTNNATKIFPDAFTAAVTNVGETLYSGVLLPGASITKTGTGTASATVTGTVAMFAAFEGTGTITASVTDVGSFACLPGFGDITCAFTDTGEVIDVLTYDYTAVPEPTTLALLGGALGGLAIARRRRRNARQD